MEISVATKQRDVVDSPEENHPVIGHFCEGELPGAVQKVAQIKLGKVLSPPLERRRKRKSWSRVRRPAGGIGATSDGI